MDSNEIQQPTAEESSYINSMTSEPASPMNIKHSGPGIASFVLSMLSLLGYIASVALIGAIIAPHLSPESLSSPSEELIQIIGSVGLLVILFIILNIIGVILSIIGVVLKNRKKIFAILGLIINGVIVLCLTSFFIYAVVNATT
ncbi:hypothetical protein PNBC_07040 [Paenibacillus crassostreae]|uniref:DUF4064 domain-containing protein n=2 Tax=Paenibacillus crassostreae TaxID=1763538 RepID=A0A167G285_9BACL|nr:hypothetical protein PNBC_07040 [Paenibacillus crassostreae]